MRESRSAKFFWERVDRDRNLARRGSCSPYRPGSPDRDLLTGSVVGRDEGCQILTYKDLLQKDLTSGRSEVLPLSLDWAAHPRNEGFRR